MILDMLVKIFADGFIIPIVVVGSWVLVFKIPKGKKYESYCRILLAGLTAYLFAKLIGHIYQPSYLRPFEILGVSPGASYLENPGFPSDHVLFAMSIACAVWFETRDKVVTSILLLFVACLGIGRIAALVHSPIDVIGGMVIAVLGAVWYRFR